MKKQNKYVLKNKQVLKLFRFITIFSIKRRGGKTAYYLFGLPIWKVRRMDNENLIKYYLFNIPILRFYYVSTPSATDIMLSKLLEIETTQQILADKINLCSNNLFSVKNELPLLENKLLLAEKINSDELQQIDNLHLQFLQHAEQLQDMEDRIKVYHAETLERFDNLPKKEKQ